MKILIVENDSVTFGFRKELIDTLLEDNELGLVGDFNNEITSFYEDKLKLYPVKTELKSKNIFKNAKLKKTYRKIIGEFNPDVLLTFTIKPNIYCNLKKNNCITIANITGLGSAFNKNGLLKSLVVHLYKKSFKNIMYVMFQNEGGLECFKANKITVNNYSIIPGSGINDEKYQLLPLDNHKGVNFLFPSRPIEQKGFYLLLNAIPDVIKNNSDAHFVFLGNLDENARKHIEKLEKDVLDHIKFHPFEKDIVKHYKECDFVVSPSFYNEGISNVLLEALACGRPIITTNDNYGCKEVLQEGVNGFGVKSRNIDSLVNALNKACQTSKDQIEKMGKSGRDFVIKNFNRKTTIQTYLDTIKKCVK